MSAIREKGATSGAGLLATFGYDDLGRRTSLTRGNGAVTTYTYDPVSRLGSMTHDLAGATHDLTLGFTYNPASQIVSTTRSNNLYSWNGHGSGTTSSTANGLNQLATHAGGTPTYDARGNLLTDGTYAYTYSSENLMTSGANSGLLEYDPLMRFYKSGPTYFIHEGGQLVGDYFNGSIVSRYIPGPGTDEAVAEVFKTGARTWYHADERGSVIAGSNATGANARIVLFDEYGKRGSGGSFRFAFTGQVHLINDIYDYKARNYNARLGRFVQTDPIGYGDGMNMYGYVGDDPVNFSDPSGLTKEGRIVCTGSHIAGACGLGGLAGGLSGFSSEGVGGRVGGTVGEAYQAAGGVLGPWASKPEIEAVVDYLMGNSTLGAVAVSLLYDQASLAQSEGRGYLDTFRLGTNATVDTLLGILKDPDVRSAMLKTFDRSFSEQREWGFWIERRGSDYFAHKAQPGDGALINIFEFRASGANIAFHTHPFINLPQGLSGLDLLRAHRNSILLISLSPRKIDWADYRRSP